MNKNVFLIYLIGLIVVIYIIDNWYLLTKTKSNENFDAVSDNASGNIHEHNSSLSKTISKAKKLNDGNETESELLDLLKSQIESEIDQITGAETKTETETEPIISSNSGGTGLAILIIFIIIFIFCCSSCLLSIFTPSVPVQPVQPIQPIQPIVYQYPPSPPPVYSYSLPSLPNQYLSPNSNTYRY